MQRLIIILWACLSTAVAVAQSTGNKRAAAAYQKAQESLTARDPMAAINHLYEAIAEDNRFTEAYQVLGDVFRLQGDFQNAVTNYRKVVELDPAFSERTWYGLGVSLFHLEEYAGSRSALEKYLSAAEKDNPQLALVKQYIASSEFAIKAVDSPVIFKPLNLGPSNTTEHDERSKERGVGKD